MGAWHGLPVYTSPLGRLTPRRLRRQQPRTCSRSVSVIPCGGGKPNSCRSLKLPACWPIQSNLCLFVGGGGRRVSRQCRHRLPPPTSPPVRVSNTALLCHFCHSDKNTKTHKTHKPSVFQPDLPPKPHQSTFVPFNPLQQTTPRL